MKRGVVIGLIVVVVIVVIVVALSFNSVKTIRDTQDSSLDGELGDGKNINAAMPVPGHEDVDEMIVEDVGNLDCEKILTLETPVDLSLVTSILYPGQIRSGDYKPHGGFRFDENSDNRISIKVPIDSYLVRGSRSKTNGVVQYLFEFKNECNVLYRFDHLLILSPKLQAIADTLPAPIEGDSRTTNLDPIEFSVGEEIAIEVGLPNNVFVDFGVYDYREENAASQTSELIKQYPSDLASHGVCWFDWLSPEDSIMVKSLPGADGVNGKESDYC